ncbi:MAG: Crp/Fnr family transcriptional regulator [Bacteroidia bacterium]|nr:Crp/Fnr family transcriptional regulator [Bacteroidia bacterium]
MNKFLTNLKRRASLSEIAINEVTSRVEVIDLKKGELFLREQQICQHLYFLDSGVVRIYHTDKGKEISTWFYNEDQFFTTWYSFVNKVPGFEYLEAVTSCKVFALSYENLTQLCTLHPEFEAVRRNILEEQLAFIDYFSKGYMFLSAKERYQHLLAYFPSIELHVKLMHIASFLGISLETLSRLRSGSHT